MKLCMMMMIVWKQKERDPPSFSALSGFSANGVGFRERLLQNRERLTWNKSLTVIKFIITIDIHPIVNISLTTGPEVYSGKKCTV